MKLPWMLKAIIKTFKHDRVSKGEKFINNWLKNNKKKYKWQMPLITPEKARNSHLIILDFLVFTKKGLVAIEYNGRQHYEYVKFFHKGGVSDFEKQKHRDELVRKYCKDLHIKLVEIPYTYSNTKISKVLEETFN